MPSEQPAPLHACAGQLCCGLAGLIGHSSRCSRCPGPGLAFEAATSVSEWRALRETGAPASVGVDVVEGSALCLRSEGRLAFDMRRRTMPPMVDDVSLGYVTVVVFRKKKKKLAALKEQIQMRECEVPERTMA